METIIGVRFKTAGKIYHFSPGQLTIARGQHVIVETARGMECGRVVTGPEEVELAPDAQPLKVIQRIANEHDMQRVEDNRKHDMPLPAPSSRYQHGNNKTSSKAAQADSGTCHSRCDTHMS